LLKRQGIVSVWHDRRLWVGSEIDKGISGEIESVDIILLLVSPDFLASDYCYGVKMMRALQRHENGEARVIPVILRPCDWHHTPFSKLLAAPKDGKPVTRWTDRDEAYLDVANAIRQVAQPGPGAGPTTSARQPIAAPSPITTSPGSSNLRLRKTFTEHDRDVFLDEAFAFMARLFENSLEELKARNPGY